MNKDNEKIIKITAVIIILSLVITCVALSTVCVKEVFFKDYNTQSEEFIMLSEISRKIDEIETTVIVDCPHLNSDITVTESESEVPE